MGFVSDKQITEFLSQQYRVQAVDLREYEIDPDLDRIILDCLAKDPDARPRSAQELSERLAAVERRIGEWSPERAEKWWRAHLPQYVAKETVPAASAIQVETA